jgi:exosortase sorting signal-containing protein
MNRSVALAAVVLNVLLSSTALAVDITDCCDWTSGWSFSSYAVNGGSATATVEGSGGNPGARLNITTVTPTAADTAFGTALLTTSTTPAPLSGAAFTLRIDALSGAGAFGQGQAIQLLVQQGGAVYAASLGITGFPLNSFTTLTFGGTFTPAAFTLVSGAGPATPTFDGSTPTLYGFAAGNNQSAVLTQYYDNFRLTIPSLGIGGGASAATPVPTLSEMSVVALAFLLAAVVMLRRRRTR